MKFHPVTSIAGVYLTPLDIIKGKQGEVRHAMKGSDVGYCGFGEAYFSLAPRAVVKDWKLHKAMTLNIIVIQGSITFIIWDNRKDSSSFGFLAKVKLSIENYLRLTIAPQLRVSFRGEEDMDNLLLNIADIEHNPQESQRRYINDSSMPKVWDIIE